MNTTDIQPDSARQWLVSLFQRGLAAVQGESVVAQALSEDPMPAGECAVLVIGKAAASMAAGARQILGNRVIASLVITKQGHCADLPRDSQSLWACYESGHPLPDQRSLAMGQRLLTFLEALPEKLPLLVLISGGTSALVEVLPADMSLDDWRKVNRWLLGSGYDIGQINAIRQRISAIKGGKLCRFLGQRYVRQLLISDVPADDPRLIGSGLFCSAVDWDETRGNVPGWIQAWLQPVTDGVPQANIETRIVASNAMASDAIVNAANAQGIYAQHQPLRLQGEATQMAQAIVAELKTLPAGVYVWGGETTVTLPETPGIGGRNQHFALAIACLLQGSQGITVLAAGTDGSDGPTEDAGAIVDGQTLQRASTDLANSYACLERADAGTLLAEAGDLISTGPTGTNVMDVVIALIEAGAKWPQSTAGV